MQIILLEFYERRLTDPKYVCVCESFNTEAG